MVTGAALAAGLLTAVAALAAAAAIVGAACATAVAAGFAAAATVGAACDTAVAAACTVGAADCAVGAAAGVDEQPTSSNDTRIGTGFKTKTLRITPTLSSRYGRCSRGNDVGPG